jgi:hypothetical protein
MRHVRAKNIVGGKGAEVDPPARGFWLVYKTIMWKSNALQQNMARKIIVVV